MKAILVKVNSVTQTRAKLPSWTDDDYDQIIRDVQNGIRRVITELDCEDCKKDLEQNGGAEVELSL